jgi:hypothetical protein
MPGYKAWLPNVLENVTAEKDMTAEKDSIATTPLSARFANLFT